MKDAPERIYGWLDSQLNIARFYGSISMNGHTYVIAESEHGQPLVRADVMQREKKSKKAQKPKNPELLDLLRESLL